MFLIDRCETILGFTGGHYRSNRVDSSKTRRKYISCARTASFFTRVFHRSKLIITITQVAARTMIHADIHSLTAFTGQGYQ